MPQCVNDPSANYIGTEPSPKGRGYCAHAEKIGSRKRGLDGCMWVVTRDKNNRPRWTHVTSGAKISNRKRPQNKKLRNLRA